MAHALARSFQQSLSIFKVSATKKPHVDVISKDTDVAEGRIADTGGGVSVMHQLHDVVPAFPHPNEPLKRDRPQLGQLFVQPGVDRRIPSYCPIEP